MVHELPPLPYAKDALEPHMSSETLEFHHDKHHQAYVTNLNNMIMGTEFEDATLEEIIEKAGPGGIYNNGAQVWNHTFFWNCLAPNAGGQPSGTLAEAIDRDFGSFEQFKDEFTKAAVTRFGSGWAWLVKDGDKLAVLSTANGDNPVTDGKKPLLTCDVWEHAYYIDYRNARPKFVEAFWNLVNWEFVAQNL